MSLLNCLSPAVPWQRLHQMLSPNYPHPHPQSVLSVEVRWWQRAPTEGFPWDDIRAPCDMWKKSVCACDNYHRHESRIIRSFLANVNSRSHSLYAIAVRPSVCRLSVRNVGAPYSAVGIFGNFSSTFGSFASHPLTSTENFTDIVPGKPLRRGV